MNALHPRRLMPAVALLLAWAAPAHADLYVTNSFSDNIFASIQDADCGTFSGNIPVGSRPMGLAVHPDGSKVYVSNGGSGTVSVVSTLTRSVVATIPVGGSPFGHTSVAVHPNGTRVYVLSSNRVAVIDTASNSVVANVFVTGIANDVAVHPDGTRVYVVTQAGVVAVIGVASNLVLRTDQVAVMAFGIAMNADGTRAYITTSDGVSGSIKVLDTTTSAVTTVPVQGGPFGIAVHPDGTKVYATSFRGQDGIAQTGLLIAIDTATNTVIGEFETGRDPTQVAIDGKFIYVTNQLDANVSVFDRSTHASIDFMEVGSLPFGVATHLPTSPPALPEDIELTSIEVTQGIQDTANGVILVAGRRTFVRVHVKSARADGQSLPNVAATLFGVKEAECVGTNCRLPLGSIQPASRITVSANPRRLNPNDSFLFELPWEWTSDEPLDLYAVVSVAGGPVPSACRLDAPTNHTVFVPPATLNIQLIRGAYDEPGNPPGNPIIEATVNDQNLSESWLRRAFPLSNLVSGPDWRFYDAGLLSRVDQSHQDCQALKSDGPPPVDNRNLCAYQYLTTIPALAEAAVDVEGAYVLIPQDPAVPFTRGACCNNARVGAGPSQPTVFEYYTAHELGHLLGRGHPVPNSQTCGHSADDPDFPYGLALIHPQTPYDPQTGLLGFDAGDSAAAPPQPRRFLGNFNSFDVMSYCSPTTQWPSDYTYRGIHNFLRGVRPFGTGPGAAGPQLGDWLMVLGHITPGIATPAYVQTRRVDRVLTIPARAPGNHSIRLTGAGGAILADYAFVPQPAADADTSSFSHVVPFVAGAREIQIIDSSTGTSRVIGGKAVSATAPTIGNVTFQGTPGPNSTAVTLQWSASDADGDPLTFDIFLTRNGGVSLQPLMGSLSGSSAQIDTTRFGGSVQFRVVATDGVHSAFSDSPTLNLAIKPPTPRIVTPGSEATIVEGQFVNFEGAATDPQDGVIPESGLSWSVQGGPPSGGSKFTLADLALGAHDVVLTATNSLGVSATTTARVIVNPNVPVQVPVLTAVPGELVWHVQAGEQNVQTASVQINNAGPGVLGFTVATTAPWLFVDTQSGTAPSTIAVTADPSGFADGVTKAAAVTVTAIGIPEQTVTIPVTLSVGNTVAVGGVVTPDTQEPPVCAADVTSQISVTRGGFRLNRINGRYVQQVTVRNIGSTAVSGPVSLVLDSLSSHATFANKTADTACAMPAAPYINMNVGTDNVLSAGESAVVVLEFANTASQAISYSTRLLAGSDAR